MKKDKNKEVPIWHKTTLTVEEAIALTNIGECKIRELLNTRNCPFVIYVGRKALIKRVKFEEFLENEFSI